MPLSMKSKGVCYRTKERFCRVARKSRLDKNLDGKFLAALRKKGDIFDVVIILDYTHSKLLSGIHQVNV